MQTILNKCTYQKTGENFFPQYWKHCYDCFVSMSEGACLNCIQICHQGHTVGPLKYGKFYCDCGSKQKCVPRINGVNLENKENVFPPKVPFDLKPISIQPIAPRLGKYSSIPTGG